MKITIFDTGAGNLHSLAKALVRVVPEAELAIETDGASAVDTDLLVLPGVGAFAAAAQRIAASREVVRAALLSGLPCIGICLGMQLLLTESEEGAGRGLDVIAGKVTRIESARAPHMGWTSVRTNDPRLRAALPSAVYYAHSFACRPDDGSVVVAKSEIPGDRFPAMVRLKNTVGCQFHPEKSSREGVAFLGWLVAEVTA